MITGTLTKIIEAKKNVSRVTLRDYIGASLIGSDCMRQIWYSYHGKERQALSNRTQRILDVGKKLESYILELLIEFEFGFELILPDQFNHYLEFFDAEYPFIRGHCDALIIIDGKKYILEIKTAKDSSFKKFVNSGLKLWNKQYYSQLQTYMGISDIQGAYILVLNKDNSMTHDEFVSYDIIHYLELREKAIQVHNAKSIPPKINNSPAWYQCKMCDFNKECHGI